MDIKQVRIAEMPSELKKEGITSSGWNSQKIYIDTDSLSTIAGKLEQKIQKLEDDLQDIVDKMNLLDANWDGVASGGAMSSFESIKGKINSQKGLLNSCIKSLKTLVITGYADTEITNVRLSDAFE